MVHTRSQQVPLARAKRARRRGFFRPRLALLSQFVVPQVLKPNAKKRVRGLALHASWTNPWDDRPSVMAYQPRFGAMGLYLGYRVRFGGLDR